MAIGFSSAPAPTPSICSRKQADAWTHRAAIATNAVTGIDVLFGAVGAAGDWLLVGQQVIAAGRGGRGANTPAPPPGKVYAFKRGGDGAYAFAATILSPEQDPAGDNFGSAISMTPTAALIGASGQSSRAGLVHEFELDANGGGRGRAVSRRRASDRTRRSGRALF